MAWGENAPEYDHPVKGSVGISTEHMAGAIVIGALVFLILVGRGFRGVNVGGASVSVR